MPMCAVVADPGCAAAMLPLSLNIAEGFSLLSLRLLLAKWDDSRQKDAHTSQEASSLDSQPTGNAPSQHTPLEMELLTNFSPIATIGPV